MRASLKICLSLSILLPLIAQADSEAMKLLDRTNLATQQLNYDGVFGFQTGDKLHAVRIIHRTNREGDVERLVSLSGMEREHIRVNDMVTCIYPDGESVQANRRPLGLGFPNDLLKRLKLASPFYTFTLGQQSRTAGHQTQELIVTPIDNYRYGYRLWVAKDSSLLLQSDLMGDSGNVLRKISFSSVKMGLNISEQSLKPQMKGNKVTWNRSDKKRSIRTPIHSDISIWKVAWLPEGFSLVVQRSQFKARNGAIVEQRVYSDGLSSISVFIEKIRARQGHLRGGSKRGAVNAFGMIMDAHFVTVVGEVPARTVEKVGSSISRSSVNQND